LRPTGLWRTGSRGRGAGAIAALTVCLSAWMAATQELPRPKKIAPPPAAPAAPAVPAGMARPAPPSAELVVATDIEARIRVDGDPEIMMKADDVTTIKVSPGDHLLTVVSTDKLIRRQLPVSAKPGTRTIVSLSAAGDLEEARADFEILAREKRAADAIVARADRFARLPWIALPAVTALVGCAPGDARCLADERPSRSVAVEAFDIMATEVSVAQFEAFARSTGTTMPAQPAWSVRRDMPVVNVPWAAARDFCASVDGRLPTEVEWERAARAAGGTVYPWGDRFASGAANVSGGATGDDWMFAAPVATFPATGAGLFDLIGNVWEWTSDEQGAFRVIKGGGWSSPPAAARISIRGRLAAASFDETVGCRCVRPAR
jgi:sulfatase modifying factor 1